MLIENNAKTFQNPDTGTFLGTVIDVVDLGRVKTPWGEKVKIRIVWVLDKNDSEGRPFRVMRQVSATMNEKGALYELVKGVLGTAPPVPFDDQTLIGRSNQLVIVKEKDAKTGREFANVKVILPLPQGAVPPRAPADFVRSKDRPAQGQQVAQAAAPPVAQPTPAPQAQAVAAPQVDVAF